MNSPAAESYKFNVGDIVLYEFWTRPWLRTAQIAARRQSINHNEYQITGPNGEQPMWCKEDWLALAGYRQQRVFRGEI